MDLKQAKRVHNRGVCDTPYWHLYGFFRESSCTLIFTINICRIFYIGKRPIYLMNFFIQNGSLTNSFAAIYSNFVVMLTLTLFLVHFQASASPLNKNMIPDYEHGLFLAFGNLYHFNPLYDLFLIITYKKYIHCSSQIH